MREDVHSIAARMPPEDDWFFGAEMRLEGQVREIKLSALCFWFEFLFLSCFCFTCPATPLGLHPRFWITKYLDLEKGIYFSVVKGLRRDIDVVFPGCFVKRKAFATLPAVSTARSPCKMLLIRGEPVRAS